MLKSLFEFTKQLLDLTKDTEDNKNDIQSMHIRVETVSDTLKQVIFEIQRLKENDEHEREKMALRLENILLRSDRNLLTDNTDEKSRFKVLEEQIDALRQEIESLKRRIEKLEK